MSSSKDQETALSINRFFTRHVYPVRDALVALFTPKRPENVPPVDAVFTKIAWELRKLSDSRRELFTSTQFRFGMWLSSVLTRADFQALDDLEKEVGEEEANRRMGASLASSGFFLWHEDSQEVQACN